METKFKFNSQICTTREQSERLIALGLKKETADMALVPLMEWDDCTSQEYFTGIYMARTKEDVERYNLDYIPAWSQNRMIEMTKLKVTLFLYGVKISHPQWERAFVKHANVWDNLCDCIEWLIKEGYFNKEYLV